MRHHIRPHARMLVLALATCSVSMAQAARPFIDDVKLGLDTVSYIDPEFYSERNLITFQDKHRRMWLGALDPLTGLLKNESGMDTLVDTMVAEIQVSVNAAEFGSDDSGAAVFYTKDDTAGHPQIWRVQLDPSLGEPEQLTHCQWGGWGNFAYYDTGSPTTTICYIVEDSIHHFGGCLVADESAPDSGWELPYYGPQTGPRKVPGTGDLVYCRVTSVQPLTTQLARFNWETKEVLILTDDPGLKSDAWVLVAPEYGGELLYAAQVDTHQIGIWRYMGRQGGMLTKVDSIMVPTGSEHTYVNSLEAVIASTSDSTTYFAAYLSLRSDPLNPGDGAIWVLGLGRDPQDRFAIRVDSGAITGDTANRYEPEVYVGAEEVFIMYNTWRPGHNDLHRCRTGITLATTSLLQGGDSGFRPQARAASIARGHLCIDAMVRKTGRQWEWDLLDATGRKVTRLRPGTNDVRALAPGVYFLIGEGSTKARTHSPAAFRVVVTR